MTKDAPVARGQIPCDPCIVRCLFSSACFSSLRIFLALFILSLLYAPYALALDEPSSMALDEPSSMALDEPSSMALDEPSSKALDEPSSEAEEPATSETIIDTVVASVGEDPITLRELCSQLSPPRELSFGEAASDPEARSVLDVIILEKLIEAEAKEKRVDVADHEIDRYINEVAQRNSLSREGFEQALKDEGKSIEEYEKKIRVEILKSKLVTDVMKSGPGVGEKEVDEYLETHPELVESGSKVKLSQIFVGTGKRSESEAQELVKKLRAEFEAGTSFPELAMKYSDSPDAATGGSLGVLAQEDLNPQVFDAIFSLEENELSETVPSSSGLHLFWVEERFGQSEEDEQQDDGLRAEVRRRIEQEKLQEKMQLYFSSDLYKSHAVDKKI